MFMAEVLSINADEKYIDEKGAFDITKCDLIAYANGKYFELGKQVGKFGYSVQKKKRQGFYNESKKISEENIKKSIKQMANNGINNNVYNFNFRTVILNEASYE